MIDQEDQQEYLEKLKDKDFLESEKQKNHREEFEPNELPCEFTDKCACWECSKYF